MPQSLVRHFLVILKNKLIKFFVGLTKVKYILNCKVMNTFKVFPIARSHQTVDIWIVGQLILDSNSRTHNQGCEYQHVNTAKLRLLLNVIFKTQTGQREDPHVQILKAFCHVRSLNVFISLIQNILVTCDSNLDLF